jgi:hypothetical protein
MSPCPRGPSRRPARDAPLALAVLRSDIVMVRYWEVWQRQLHGGSSQGALAPRAARCGPKWGRNNRGKLHVTGRSFPIPCHAHPSFPHGRIDRYRLSSRLRKGPADEPMRPRSFSLSFTVRSLTPPSLDMPFAAPISSLNSSRRSLNATCCRDSPDVVADWLCLLSEHCAVYQRAGSWRESPDHGVVSALTKTPRRCNICASLAGGGACVWMLSPIDMRPQTARREGQVVSSRSTL